MLFQQDFRKILANNQCYRIVKLQFLFSFMSDKIRNYLGEFSPQSNPPINIDYSYTFKKQQRRTLGSEEDLDDKSIWNMSTTKLPHFYSPPKNKYDFLDYNKIIEENQRLKEEIKGLKQLLVSSHVITKNYEKIDGSLRFKKDQKSEQITKLKKILEKSYYSIKQMEEEILRLNQQLTASNKNLNLLGKKYKIVQFQKQELQSKFKNMNLVHKEQIEVCSERIWRLQMKIKDLIQIIEQDQLNWSAHAQQLNNLKKFYHRGTSK